MCITVSTTIFTSVRIGFCMLITWLAIWVTHLFVVVLLILSDFPDTSLKIHLLAFITCKGVIQLLIPFFFLFFLVVLYGIQPVAFLLVVFK